MAENLNPITGLPEDNERKAIKKPVLKPVQRSGAAIDQSRISPMADLVKPVDISETIPEKAPSLNKQLVTGEDFKAGANYSEILDKYNKNLINERNNYLKKLDEEQGLLSYSFNAFTKFAGKTVARVGLGLAGTGVALGKLISGENPLEKNIFQEWEEKAVAAIDEAFPIYSDNPNYHNLGFMEKLFTEPGKMFGDEIGDAISFMGSAILQEVILSAATAASMGAAAPLQASASIRLGKQAADIFKKGFNTIPKLVKGKAAFKNFKYTDEIAKTLDKTGDIAKAKNLMHMGASVPGLAGLVHYEAGIEANGTYDAMLDTFRQQYIEKNGVEPTEAEMKNAEKAASDARAATYAINAAILLPSHLIQFGSAFKKMYGASRNLSKATGQIVREGGEYMTKHAAKSKTGKLLTYAGLTLKNPITEAGEEFMQGVAHEGNLEYFSRYYSPESHKDSLSYLNSMAKSGVEYFNSTEGGNSMGIGAIVGLLGLPLPKKLGGYSGGIIGDIKEYNKTRRLAEELIANNKLNDGTLNNILQHNYKNFVVASSLGQEMEDASNRGDAYEYKNLEHDQLFSYLYNRVTLGLSDDIQDDINSAREMSLEEFNKSWVGESHKPLNESEKAATLDKLSNTVKDIQKYSEAAENIIEYNSRVAKENNEELRELGNKVKPFLVHAAATLKNTDVREEELVKKLTEISNLSEEEIKNLTVESKHRNALGRLGSLARKQKSGKELSEKEKAEMKELRDLTKINAKALLDLYQGQEVDPDLNMLRSISGEMTDLKEGVDQKDFMDAAIARLESKGTDTKNKINKTEILSTLEDLAKVKNRRESFGKYYDYLSTPEGLKALGKVAEQAEENLAETVEHVRKESAKEKAETAKTPAEKQAAKDYASEISPEVEKDVAKKENEKSKEQLKNTPKVNNVTEEALIDRYKITDEGAGNSELFTKEGKALINILKEIGAGIHSSALEEPGFFIQHVLNEYENREDVAQAINDFYSQINNSSEELKQQEKYDPEDREQEETQETSEETLEQQNATQTSNLTEEEITEDAPVEPDTPQSVLSNVNTAGELEFALYKDPRDGYWHTKVDANGDPIKAPKFINRPENQVDFDHINNGKVQEGDTLLLKVDKREHKDQYHATNAYGQAKFEDIFRVLILHVDAEGVQRVVGTLPQYKNKIFTRQDESAKNLEIHRLRLKLLEEMDKKGEVFISKYTSKVAGVGAGKIYTTGATTSIERATGKKPLLAVVKTASGENYLEAPNSNADVKNIDSELLIPGAIYALDENQDGTYTPVPVKIRAVSEEELQKVSSLLIELTQDVTNSRRAKIRNKIKDIVYVDVYNSREGNGLYDIHTGANNYLNGRTLEEVLQFARNRKVQIDAEQLNKGEYNSEIDGNKIKIVLNPAQKRHSKTVHFETFDTGNANPGNSDVNNITPEQETAAEAMGGILPKQENTGIDEALNKFREEAREKGLALTEDNKAYKDKEGNEYDRVSSLKKKKKKKEEGEEEEEFTNNEAADRGTIIDSLLRDFIAGNITSVEALKEAYNNQEKGESKLMEDSFLEQLYSIFENVKSEAGSLELVSDIPTLWGEINGKPIAGTIDLLGVDKKNGKIYIIDLKTSTQNRRDMRGGYYEVYKEGDTIQQSGYAELLAQRTGLLVSKVSVLPMQVNKGETYTSIIANTAGGKMLMEVEIDPEIFDKQKHLEKDTTTEEVTPKTDKVIENKNPKPKDTRRGKRNSRADKEINDANFKFATDETRKWDKEKSMDWMAKNLPNIPAHIVDDISRIANTGGRLAWGVFKDKMIYIAKNAGRGTAYHEAFHAVFHLSLNENERAKLLQEAQAETGYATDLELEEWLADKFEQYVLENYLPNTLGSRIKRVFKQFMNWINLLKSKDSITIEELFDNINYGVYKNTKISDAISAPTRLKLAQFTTAEKVERIDMLNNLFLNILSDKIELLGASGNMKDALNNYRYMPKYVTKRDKPYVGIEAYYVDMYENDLQAVRDVLEAIIESDYNQAKLEKHPDYPYLSEVMVKKYMKMSKNDVNYAFDQIDMVMDEFFEGKGDNMTFAPKNLVKEATYGLRKFGIKINMNQAKGETSTSLSERQVELTEGESDTATTEDAETYEAWQFSRAETSLKDTASFFIRHELSKFVDEKYVNGKRTAQQDRLGFKKKLDFDTVFNDLKHDLSSATDLNEMIAILKSKSKFKPYYNQVVNKLESNQDGYLQFRSAFLHTMATSKINYAMQLISSTENELGEIEYNYSILESNRKSPSKIVRNEWNALFNYLDSNNQIKDVAKHKKEVRDIIKGLEINKPKTLSNGDALKLSNRLNKIGVALTAQDLQASYESNKGAFIAMFVGKGKNPGLLNAVYGAILSGSNPYSIGKGGETTALTPFLNIAVNTRRNLYESAFMNVDNKQVFSNMIPNFMQRLVTNLAGAKSESTIAEYKKDRFFSNNLWLNELSEDLELRSKFKMSLLDGRKVQGEEKGKKYTKLSPRERFITELVFFNNEGANEKAGKYAKYTMPILADAPQLALIDFKKYSNEEVINHFFNIAKTEAARIEDVKKDQKDKNYNHIQNYHYVGKADKEGFAKAKGLEYHYVPDMSDLDLFNAEDVITAKERIREMLEKEAATIKQLGIELGINEEYKTKELPKSIGNVNAFMKNYAYNQALANANMLQLFSNDAAYYKAQTDIAKRNKQISNPGQILDETQTGKSYDTMYLKDIEFTSNFIDIYERVLEGSPFKDSIIAQYKTKEDGGTEGVNATDAQSLISLDRWKKIMKGAGVWDKSYDAVFERLKSGEGTLEDIAIVAQPIKPFYFGNEYSAKHKKYMPTQNKNSEYVVFPQMLNSIPEDKRSTFETVLELLSGPDALDSIQFESAVKVGIQKVVDFNSLKGNQKAIANAKADNRITLLNRNYRIQLAVPEHHVDETILFPTQIRKAVLSNINLDATYIVNGEEITGKDMFDKYQAANTLNLEEDFAKIAAIVKDPNQLAEMLRDEVLDRGLSEKYLKALELDNGKFKFPLWFPLSAKRNESLLASLFRNRVTKQRIKGGTFVQVSDFIYSDHLKVTTKEVTYTDAEGNKQTKEVIDSMEAILPWWTKQYMPLDENGLVDVNKIPEPLRELVSLRIPTEDKYSFPVIKVVGFSPKTAGGTAILPADITRRAGTDFDVDKLFIMMPEFEVETKYQRLLDQLILEPEASNFDDTSLWDIMKGEGVKVKYKLEDIKERDLYELERLDISEEEYEEREDAIFNAFDQGVADIKALEAKVAELKPDFQTITPLDADYIGNKKERNNFMIEVIKGVMRHPLHQEESLNPGSFQTLKDLKKAILEQYGKSSEDVNMMFPSSQLELFKRNMAAKDLIGIFANHLSNHNVVQHTNIELASGIKVRLKGSNKVQELKSLNSIKNQEGKLISRTLSEFVAASVDNAKEPVLSDLNISPFTANMVALFVRTGIPLGQAMVYFNQPAILELSKRVENGESFNSVFKSLKDKYSKNSKYKTEGGYYLDFNELRKHMKSDGVIKSLKGQELEDFATQQFIALMAFANNKSKADSLDSLVRAAKADAVGAKSTTENDLFISNVNKVLSDPNLNNVSELLEGNAYPFVRASYEKGILGANTIMGKYFPWSKNKFAEVKGKLTENKGKDLTDREIEFVNYNILTYLASDFDFFKNSPRELFNLVYEFPLEFKKKLSESEDLRNNPFLKAVYFEDASLNKEGIPRIITNNTSRLEPLQQWAIENGFMELYKNPETKKFAEQLIKYSFINNGFNYGPESYNHLLPLDPYETIMDEKGNTLMEHLENNFTNFNSGDFVIKFAQNYANKYAYFEKISPKMIEVNSKKVARANNINGGDFITSFIVEKANKLIKAKDVIVSNSGGQTLIYKKEPSGEKDKTVLYTLVNQIGKENYFVQYNRDVEGIDSVINQRDLIKFFIRDENGKSLRNKEGKPEVFTYKTREDFKAVALTAKELGLTLLLDQSDVASVEKEIEDANPPKAERDFKDYELYKQLDSAPGSPQYYTGDITPESNTIFVFGSNPEGRHGAGAAKIARNQFGAVYGKGEGLYGNSYALPTKDLRVKKNKGFKSISPEQITSNIKKLYEVANQNPDKKFKVAYRNTTQTSLNGYTGLEMIDMFNAAGTIPSNVIFSKEWYDTGKLNLSKKNLEKSENIPSFARSVESLMEASIEDFTLALIETYYIPENIDVYQKRPDLGLTSAELKEAREKILSGEILNRFNEVYASVQKLYDRLQEIRSANTDFPMIQGKGGNATRQDSPSLRDFLESVVQSYVDLGKENDSDNEICIKGIVK